ncbi:MAG TPA: LuxR C-terminal-related transcriptional regulator [Amycolatopsis sp.]|jgi:non-specific serine/threonine protein kinase|nr:LuxR C-terminal-related transcriptional regulator [Amycolatopsis sp.]
MDPCTRSEQGFRAAAGGSGNLPAQLTSFVDRRSEVAEAKRMLSAARLVTLKGPGGVGKTRLALKVATDLRRTFGDGVWLVELGKITDPARLVPALAEAVGLPEQPDRPLEAALEEFLGARRVLLVLDNCEHVVEVAAAVIGSLLRFCPRLRVLVTSREPLDIPGEAVLSVPPLSVPPRARPVPLAELSTFSAVALFVDRATSAVAGFRLTEANREAVTEICRRLDGLPLAIELAAVRLRMLSVWQIAQRLSNRYGLLTAGARAAPTRQQTLRSCIQWSYDLCSPPERVLWARLAIFDGGFELKAAEDICTGDGATVETLDGILDLLASLADQSILVIERDAVVRYRMLDSIRDFGREKLREIGEYPVLSRRYRSWYADLVARVNVALGVGVVAWRQGDAVRALELLEKSLRLKREMDEPLGTAWCLEALAWIAAGVADHRRAATLLGAAAALAESTGVPTSSSYLAAYHERCERQVRAGLSEPGFRTAFARGMDLSVEDAISYALKEKQAEVAAAVVKSDATITRREREVARLVAEGLSNNEIAGRLVISPRTAETHVQHILLKLGFTSRAQIAAWVVELPDHDPGERHAGPRRQATARDRPK